MRLNINLATRPYQDLNRFLRRWVMAVAIFGVASVALGLFAWHQVSAGRDINQKIRAQQDQIRQFDEQKAAATKILGDPNNKQVADTAHFLNTQIAKKAFSWTRVFMQLEEIMPSRLHVMSLTPELTPSNQLQLTMRVAGDSREQAVELVRRIEKSPSFRTAVLRSESMVPPEQARGADAVIFEINAVYVPAVAPAAAAVKDKTAAIDDSASSNATDAKTQKTSRMGAKP